MSDLEDLVVDEDELNQEILTDTLEPYIRIGSEGTLIPEPKFKSLKAENQILVSLLAIKAMKELEMRESGQIGPTELSEVTGISEGTVYPKVRELEDEGLLAKEDGRYWVPNHKIRRIQDRVKQDE